MKTLFPGMKHADIFTMSLEIFIVYMGGPKIVVRHEGAQCVGGGCEVLSLEADRPTVAVAPK